MATTRHGEYGGPRSPYGSFAGKADATVTADPDFAGATIHRAHLRHVASARIRGTARAQTRRANRDR